MNFLTSVNLNKNEVQGVVLQNLATHPANPVEGQIYYNTVDKVIYKFNGTSWASSGSSYTLPVATNSILGGVKVGSGVSATSDGTLSADVISVAGKTGAITLDKSDVGLNNVDNTSDADKPISTAVQTALADKQATLTFDTTPVQNSTNPVTSGGVYTAIESAKAEGLDVSGGTMSGDINMGGNSITNLATPANSNDAATKEYVDSKVVGSIQPKGSILFANLPTLGANVLGYMYNIEDAFTTTADFVEGAGIDYGAGENIVIINTGTTSSPVYKYDVYSGIIDTSSFATKSDVNSLVTKTEGVIGTSATTVTLNYTGTLVGMYASQGDEVVMTDITKTASTVTFTVAATPATAITCTVISINALS